VDFERGLNFCIAQIRSALKDSAEAPRYVETLPRRGYRFIAPVAVVETAPQGVAPLPSEAAAGGPARAVQRQSRAVTILAVALASVVFAAVLVARHYASSADAVRVAVVPFDNETGLTEFDRIASGVADATVARLAARDLADRIAVVGNSAALWRPRAFRDLKALGDQLRVEYVVLAQVKSDGGRARVIAHLIRVRDEVHVWANTFDRPVFTLEVQSEVADAIAGAVAVSVSHRQPQVLR
jgi:TolB-like protein